jgi:hypothetical protein
MAYVMLIMEHRDRRRKRAPDEARLEYERMVRFGEDLKQRGLLRASDALKPDSQGVRLATHGGKRVVVDGPFAESKEMVGGFFVLDCQTKEQAIAIADQCPAVAWATVEVREIGTCYDD